MLCTVDSTSIQIDETLCRRQLAAASEFILRIIVCLMQSGVATGAEPLFFDTFNVTRAQRSALLRKTKSLPSASPCRPQPVTQLINILQSSAHCAHAALFSAHSAHSGPSPTMRCCQDSGDKMDAHLWGPATCHHRIIPQGKIHRVIHRHSETSRHRSKVNTWLPHRHFL